jgi:AraC-like DNA-binding protein
VLFAGQLTRAVRVAPAGDSLIVGARLRPYGGFALLGTPQQVLTDRIVPLRDLDPALAARLGEVATRPRGGDFAAALDAALATAAAAPRAHAVAIAPVVTRAMERRGLVRVADLAAHAGLSPRQLERRFGEQVGLSPKLFLRILRFQEVLHALRHDVNVGSWADMALAHGFYDQAHFIRDFKSFVGESPAAWNVSDASLAAIFSALRRGASLTLSNQQPTTSNQQPATTTDDQLGQSDDSGRRAIRSGDAQTSQNTRQQTDS